MNFIIDASPKRVSAVDDAGQEIVGAFYRDRWNLYFDHALFEPFGLECIEEHLPLFTRKQALNLVHLFAMAWLAKATERNAA